MVTMCCIIALVTCVIMQRNGAGLHTASSCYWDNTSDGMCVLMYGLIWYVVTLLDWLMPLCVCMYSKCYVIDEVLTMRLVL